MSGEPNTQFQDRAAALYNEQSLKLYRETDQLFAKFFLFEWVAGILVACLVSPRTWIGDTAYVHFHIWLATLFGALIISFPLAFIYLRPGCLITRISIAISQMLIAALFIHLSGGRIETHFFIFGSLAFLTYYRDWKVLTVATIVVALDHFIRGVWWPHSVFGIDIESPYRWMEHAGWVLFEDLFLFGISFRGIKQHKNLCQRQADLENVNAQINAQVHEQIKRYTNANAQLEREIQQRILFEQESREREFKLRKIMESTIDPMITINSQGIVQEASLSTKEVMGWTPEELIGNEITRIIPESFQELHRNALLQAAQNNSDDRSSKLRELAAIRKDGTTIPIEILIWKTLIPGHQDPLFTGIIRDISLRKQAEAEKDAMYAQLLDSTRQAGMAEVATGVLHNVGNVLNSVNISVNVMEDKLKQSQVRNLEKVSQMLDSNRESLGDFISSDRKGKQLPSYINKLSQYLISENESIVSELSELASNIAHIKEIVSVQQSYARVSGTTEIVDLEELLESILRTNHSSLCKHGITVIREFAQLPAVTTDKHKLMQILVNLITNAKQALNESASHEKNLVIRLKTEDQEQVKVEVEDNGIGIPQANLPQIFQHGFTTKENGHGFGLHSCALAASEMGGALTVFSKGSDQGALFTLNMPVNINEEATCPQ